MISSESGWLILDHPADVMIEVTGGTFWELCENAALGLNHFLGEVTDQETVRIEKIKIEGDTPEELIVNLLRELLFYFVTTFTLVTKLDFHGHIEGGMLVEAYFSPAKIGSNSLEVKGITYHGLSVEKAGSGLKARLVFDV